jgi:hypothetical protein
MIKNTRLHPFEVSFAAMLKQANISAKLRVPKVRKKLPPLHIVPREYEEQFGMFNYRLNQWVKEEYAEFPRFFKTEQDALKWYASLI